MIKTSVLRYAAIGMATLSMAGFAAASTVTLDKTGPHSNNRVELNNRNHVSVDNDNSVGVGNINLQKAHSGAVKADDITSVSGGTGSGDASNANTTATSVSIANGGAGAGAGMGNWAPADTNVSMDTTGPHSDNKVEVNNSQSVNVDNDNRVNVVNLNLQSAKSGKVSADDITTMGGLTSGDASNTNTTSTSVSIHN